MRQAGCSKMKWQTACLALLAALPLLLGGCAGETQNPYAGEILICLDAGHGGSDSGAVLDARLEKDDNLRMVLAVQAELEAQGAKVLLTRGGDTFVELAERAEMANEAGASVFVSFHRNAGGGQGAEVWIDKKPDGWETSLGQRIQKALVQAGFTDRGVKKGTAGSKTVNYTVVGRTEMPACLIELGFIDNPDDNALLDTYHSEIAGGIARAILLETGLAAE